MMTPLIVIGILILGIFIGIILLALNHHYGWINSKEKEEYKHWKERHYSTKKPKTR